VRTGRLKSAKGQCGYTKEDDTVAAAQSEAWSLAQQLYQDLQLGFELEPSPDPVLTARTPRAVRSLLDRDEFVVECLLRAEGAALQLSRFRASDWVPTGQQETAVVVGSPAMIAGYLAGSVVRRSLDRRRVQRVVEPRWRPDGPADIVATNKRIWYQLTGGQWHWLRYDTVTAMEPDARNWAFTLSFREASSHCFVGEWAPWCAVVVAHFLGLLPHRRGAVLAGLAELAPSLRSAAG
jgi:hypothetical protein